MHRDHWPFVPFLAEMDRLPLTPKVGEVSPGADKFASWSGPYGYYPRAATASPQFKTDKMLSGSFNLEELVLNRTVCTRLLNRNKNLVEFKSTEGLGDSGMRKSYSRSNCFETYVHHGHFRELMAQRGTEEGFRESFLRFQKLGADCVSYYEIDLLVKDCLGDDAPEFIISKFKEFASSYAVRGELFWRDFCTVLEKVTLSIQAETSQRRELPPLVALMTRPRIVDKNIEALGNTSTVYRDNFNRAPDMRFQEDRPELTYHKPVEEINKPMDNAAKILNAGTTKVTCHVPGYRGHIPENLRSQRKFQHATGIKPHPVVNNLRLTQRGMGCLLGYTGYVPMEPIGSHHERMTSCDPRTSNGAAFNVTGSRALL